MDEIGLLKVGPRSAGSQPGPAAYGLGGTEPTVTDADLLLGYLNPDYFAGGEIAHRRRGRARRGERLAAAACGLPPTQVAWGIHDVVNESMASAARVHIAERGRDPRDYALLCTGGAGPVHACSRRAQARPAPGDLPARRPASPRRSGLLVAPARVDRVATVGLRLDRGQRRRARGRRSARLEDEARAVMADTGLKLETAQRPAARRRALPRPGLRPGGRPCPTGPYDGHATGMPRAALTAAFETAYREKFALTPPDVPVEFINIRVAVRAPVAGSDVVVLEGRARRRRRRPPRKGERPVYFPERRRLRRDHRVRPRAPRPSATRSPARR